MKILSLACLPLMASAGISRLVLPKEVSMRARSADLARWHARRLCHDQRASCQRNGGRRRKERISGELSMPVMQTAQWLMQTPVGTSLTPETLAALRLGWTPQTLFFLTNGKGPYQLAFGKNAAANVALPLSQVAPGFQSAELLALPVCRPTAGRGGTGLLCLALADANER